MFLSNYKKNQQLSILIWVDWYKWNFKEPNSNVCFHHSFVYSAHISWDKWSPKQWTEYWKGIISDKNDDSQMMGKTSEMHSTQVIIWDLIICRAYRNRLSNVNVNETKINYNS